MKNYIVKINYSHESFNGYNHNDGDKDFKVSAKNYESAQTKALSLAKKEGGGYEKRVKSVREI